MKKAINKHMTEIRSTGIPRQDRTLAYSFQSAMDKPEQYMDNARQIFVKTVLGYDGLLNPCNFLSPESPKPYISRLVN